jgi:Lrp/AsnC family leucine-responsive transcriptional regulator
MTAALSHVAPTNRNSAVLDVVDRAIIAELRSNGRMTSEELSRRVALSRPAVVGRIKRLHEIGAIRGYTIIPDWEMLGYTILAYVQVRTNMKCRDMAQHILTMQLDGLYVEECHRLTGEWCLLVKMRATSSSVLEAFLDDLNDSGNVRATMTMLSLSTL